MSGNSKFYIVVSVLMALAVSAVGSYYLFFMKPLGERLSWVSGVYTQCKDSSSDIRPDELYWDLQRVMQGSYDKKKLVFYTDKVKQHSEGKCSSEDTAICEDSYLYVLRTFLARGDDKDIKLALTALKEYKEKRGVNIYYDLIFLDVSLYYGSANTVRGGYYDNLIDQVKGHYIVENYFNKPHGGELCNTYLDRIGAAYAKSGDHAADLYIQYHIRD